MRTLGLLGNTLLIVTADHGHSMGDEGFLGKRGYPSEPAVFDLPLLVRHPEGAGAGRTTDLLVNHTDIPAAILDFAGVESTQPLDGRPFMEPAVEGGKGIRDHVTVGDFSTSRPRLLPIFQRVRQPASRELQSARGEGENDDGAT